MLYHSEPVTITEFDAALEMLLTHKTIFRLDEFYSLQPDFLLAERRRKGNMLAASQMKTASRVARFLARFPYVKGIAVSGSLSKSFATEKTDIDFFVVTQANRLWIARTLMHLYKKLTFLTGRQHWHCMNYYVDETAMEITEKNIFTAMESVTLLPMQGQQAFDAFMKDNAWVADYFPSKKISTRAIPEIRPGMIRRLAEIIFNNPFADRLDNWLMKITAKRWHKKTSHHRLNSSGHVMSMVADRHVSKPDPKNFQDKIVEQYRVKMLELLQSGNAVATLAV